VKGRESKYHVDGCRGCCLSRRSEPDLLISASNYIGASRQVGREGKLPSRLLRIATGRRNERDMAASILP